MGSLASTKGENGHSLLSLDFAGNFNNVINGASSNTAQVRNGVNPATGEALYDVPVSGQEEVDEAVRCARLAFAKWAKVPLKDRQDAVLKFADALEREQAAFAMLLTQEVGKTLVEAQGEVQNGVRWMRELAQIRFEPESVQTKEGKQTVIRYTPLGVCAAIIPWNFPTLLACGKIGPAVVTGNTVIVKPSPYTPYSNIKLVELAQAFFPPGVIQVLSGDESLGPRLTAHPGIDKISFTGSTATGRKVMASAAQTLKRLTLELGGNDPAIVCEDVDIEHVAPKIATLALANSGQVCLAIKRIYVHESIYAAFRDAVVRYVTKLKVGSGLDRDSRLGPVQNEMQFERLRKLFKDIDTQKWSVATGGTFPPNGSKGYFITPTIIDNPAESSSIVQEEPFGPIVPLLSWTSEEEVIKRANDTKMGLGASVWTRDPTRARRIAEQLEAGSVWINAHVEISPLIPFGGHKSSGIGSEWGLSGLKSFCNVQALYLD